MKVYVVVDACSGEDYSVDDPTVLLVTTDKAKARQFFEDEISNWEDGMTNFENDGDEPDDAIGVVSWYECTDFEGDSHRILKIYAKEIE